MGEAARHCFLIQLISWLPKEIISFVLHSLRSKKKAEWSSIFEDLLASMTKLVNDCHVLAIGL